MKLMIGIFAASIVGLIVFMAVALMSDINKLGDEDEE